MSIDDRLRAGLPSMLDELLPDDVEQRLALTLRRVERRRGLRRGRYAVALVAAAAVVAAVVLRVDDERRSLEPVEPPTDQVLVLDSALGSPDEPAPLEAATYAIGFLGASDDAPWAAIEVPSGWGQDRLHPATGPDLDPHLRRIELSTVAYVAPDPCRSARAPVGPGVSALMDAIVTQTTVRPGPPRPVTVDGYSGQVVQVRVPAQVDLTRCAHRDRLVPFWLNGLTSTSVFPGWTYRVWALDVEGERLVITAALGPQTTPDEQAELLRMVETLEFIPPLP
jgi:hypothetical protein